MFQIMLFKRLFPKENRSPHNECYFPCTVGIPKDPPIQCPTNSPSMFRMNEVVHNAANRDATGTMQAYWYSMGQELISVASNLSRMQFVTKMHAC